MDKGPGPFQSIEDTLEYLSLLELTIGESSRELDLRVHDASGDRSRTGLLLALYKLSQLSECVRKSKRIVNDLQLIRMALLRTRPSERKHHAKRGAEINVTGMVVSRRSKGRSLSGANSTGESNVANGGLTSRS